MHSCAEYCVACRSATLISGSTTVYLSVKLHRLICLFFFRNLFSNIWSLLVGTNYIVQYTRFIKLLKTFLFDRWPLHLRICGVYQLARRNVRNEWMNEWICGNTRGGGSAMYFWRFVTNCSGGGGHQRGLNPQPPDKSSTDIVLNIRPQSLELWK